MSGSMRIIQQDEADKGFGLLKDIVEMVKNPKAIEAAYEARRKGAQLTDDEVAKATEARAIIAQADALREELKQGHAGLEAAKIEHTGTVKMFGDQVIKESARLNEWEGKLTDKQEKQDATDSRHNQERENLDARAREIEAKHTEWLADYDKRMETIFQTEASQKTENDRMAALAAKLKAKAARVAAEAQRDD